MLNSEVTGTGLPVLFIHGFGEDLSLWNGLRATLSKQFKVITIDLPGFGRSPSRETPFSLFDIADIVHNHMTENLGIEQFVALGHSLGGYVCLSLAKTYPQSILAFGLINSTSYSDTNEKKANRLKTIDFINKHGSSFFLQSFVPNLFTPENQINYAKDVLRVLHMGNNISDSILTSYMLAMRNRPDLSDLLSSQENILFVAGLLDPHFSYKDIMLEISLLKQFKNGHLFEDVAHMSMIEAEKQLEIIITDFLDGI